MNYKIRVRTVEPVASESVELTFRVFDRKLPRRQGQMVILTLL